MKDFIRTLLRVRVIWLDNLVKTDNFLPAFLRKFETYSSKDNVLSICTPNSFCLLDSQSLASPISAQILSCLYPPTSKWHLSSFSFISLFWNHSIAKKLSCSNLFMRDPRYLSQAKKSFFKKMKLRTYWRLPAKVFQ